MTSEGGGSGLVQALLILVLVVMLLPLPHEMESVELRSILFGCLDIGAGWYTHRAGLRLRRHRPQGAAWSHRILDLRHGSQELSTPLERSSDMVCVCGMKWSE